MDIKIAVPEQCVVQELKYFCQLLIIHIGIHKKTAVSGGFIGSGLHFAAVRLHSGRCKDFHIGVFFNQRQRRTFHCPGIQGVGGGNPVACRLIVHFFPGQGSVARDDFRINQTALIHIRKALQEFLIFIHHIILLRPAVYIIHAGVKIIAGEKYSLGKAGRRNAHRIPGPGMVGILIYKGIHNFQEFAQFNPVVSHINII